MGYKISFSDLETIRVGASKGYGDPAGFRSLVFNNVHVRNLKTRKILKY